MNDVQHTDGATLPSTEFSGESEAGNPACRAAPEYAFKKWQAGLPASRGSVSAWLWIEQADIPAHKSFSEKHPGESAKRKIGPKRKLG